VTVLLAFLALPVSGATTVTLLHFSDYHSHAVPFYSEGRMNQGGIGRAIGYLERERTRGALVFNGGDMMNKGAPAWSDQYRCAEWPWLNGVTDAMAFGNHDPDYGFSDFQRCKSAVDYPILSANTEGFERYKVVERHGIRIGVFAVAGADFPRLVKVPELHYSDPVAAARQVVRDLREKEHADAVVMIGHEHAEDDYRLAAEVPGINLIFGSHTHLKQELTRIPGTETWFISSFQYLTYISRVQMTFERRRLTRVTGKLVPIDPSLPVDQKIAARVTKMQKELEQDPKYVDLFVPFAQLARPLDVEALAALTLDTMRDTVSAELALSTTSSFRQPLPPGPVDLETLRAAMPYDNEIIVATMSGSALQSLLVRAKADPKSDAYAYVSAAPAIDPAKTYRVAITDYMANTATAYRDLFKGLELNASGKHVREEVRKRLAGHLPGSSGESGINRKRRRRRCAVWRSAVSLRSLRLCGWSPACSRASAAAASKQKPVRSRDPLRHLSLCSRSILTTTFQQL
jgi:5'-nucleotidase